jgi:hypothetical protein
MKETSDLNTQGAKRKQYLIYAERWRKRHVATAQSYPIIVVCVRPLLHYLEGGASGQAAIRISDKFAQEFARTFYWFKAFE